MVLGFITEQMAELGVPYAYYEWVDDVPLTYFVGEYVETDSMSEDGEIDGEMTLSGFTRGDYADLEKYRKLILARFRNGENAVLKGGSVAVYYDHAMTVPTGLEDVKRMDITLSTKEWSN